MQKSSVNAIKLMFAATLLIITQGSHAGAIDLTSWSQEGPAGAGDWTVAGDGESVHQSINGEPTFFISPESFINNEFTGTFAQDGVAGTWDDDYVGFVFGYNGQDDYYLFDWKQNDQYFGGRQAYAGFGLYKIGAGTKNFWDHTGTGITTLATNFAPTKGWADNTIYEFALGYTDTSITISLDGGVFDNETVIDVAGLTNSAGSFGFYNFSQQAVTYAGFEEAVCTVDCGTSVPAPAPLLLLVFGLLGLGAIRVTSAV